MSDQPPLSDRDPVPLLVQQADFEADVDRYVDAAEAGQVIGRVRDDRVVCWLRPFAP